MPRLDTFMAFSTQPRGLQNLNPNGVQICTPSDCTTLVCSVGCLVDRKRFLNIPNNIYGNLISQNNFYNT